MDRKQEQKLILAAQRGNTRAFGELYRANVDPIYRYIYRRVDSAATAEDLTADVFLRMLEGLPKYQDRALPLLSWLYRIAHARVVDHHRRNRRSINNVNIDEVELRDEVAADLDAPLVANFQSEHLREALLTLTDGQQQVIILRFIEGYNLEKTAQLLGKTVDAIKAMQYRALQALAQVLNRQGFRADE